MQAPQLDRHDWEPGNLLPGRLIWRKVEPRDCPSINFTVFVCTDILNCRETRDCLRELSVRHVFAG